MSHAAANAAEEHGGFASCVAGLSVEPYVCDELARQAAQLGFPKAGAVRHFIRLGLGQSAEESHERESYFAELAASHQQTGLDGAARFKS